MTEADEANVARAVAETFNSLQRGDDAGFEWKMRVARLLHYHLNPWCSEASMHFLHSILQQTEGEHGDREGNQ